MGQPQDMSALRRNSRLPSTVQTPSAVQRVHGYAAGHTRLHPGGAGGGGLAASAGLQCSFAVAGAWSRQARSIPGPAPILPLGKVFFQSTHTHIDRTRLLGPIFFPVIGDGRLPQRPYTGTRRHVSAHTTPHLAPRVDHSKCVAHTALACMTCKRLRKSAEECCKLGHHAASHVARRPQLQLCPLHNLPPCPRCTLKQRGVRHCCNRGHHKVCTPVPAHRKRTLPMQSLLPHKKPCLQRPARHSSGLLRSPHQPPTPPAPKRRRPKTPPPPSPQHLFHRDWKVTKPRMQ